MAEKKTLSKWTRWKCWFKYQWALQTSIGFERMYVNSWTYGAADALRYLYDDPEDLKAALRRTRDYWLCEQDFSTLVFGIYLSLEESYANNRDFDPEIIRQLKASLMGPVSGVGDAIMGGTIRTIWMLVWLDAAVAGNTIAGPAFAFPYFIFQMILCYYFLEVSYKLGKDAIQKVLGSGILNTLTKCASVMAIVIIGGMASKYTTFAFTYEYVSAYGKTVSLQSQLDGAIPGLVKLAFCLFYYWLVKSKKVNFVLICAGTLALMIVFYFTGLIA